MGFQEMLVLLRTFIRRIHDLESENWQLHQHLQSQSPPSQSPSLPISLDINGEVKDAVKPVEAQ